MTNSETHTMPDFFSGIQYALDLKGGLVPIVLGTVGSILLNVFDFDLSVVATAVPAFIASVGAVLVGIWYSYRKKQIELDRMRERKMLDAMEALVKSGFIPPDSTPEQKIEILKKFSSNF